jgi:hypothetical protein
MTPALLPVVQIHRLRVLLVPVKVGILLKTVTSRSGCAKGNGCSSTALTAEKIAVLAPIG